MNRFRSGTPIEYSYCDTEAQVISALATLSCHQYAILDCEGRELGLRGGALSLLCLGTPIVQGQAQNIFVVDVPAIIHDPPSVAALATFLSNKDIVKVVWDGRMDAIELYETLKADIGTVLDLQIAEIFAREKIYVNDDPEHKRVDRLARSGYGFRTVNEKQHLFQDLDAVIGMQRFMDDLRLSFGVGKDAEVVEMHRSGQSARWMERPLASKLLQYAAGDISVIAHLFAHFCDEGFIDTTALSTLLISSRRYVYRHGKRGRIEEADEFRPKALLVPSALHAPSVPTALCSGCETVLPVMAFQVIKKQRKTRCRVCEALVFRYAMGRKF
ncbi:hypothetical protein FA95DRAFT_896792 [Auriscalpium vulgare]|uniref:Uncharacterized protein n=1 Tax=Auriscalpium vulgare TaxID=40419 RepID=A0ACB8RZ97_9AGAM|nr:hypothetical protein FA95DRAFT_896792 [Auriscalpium vulgare]